jgi:hypothetical protein
VELLPLAEEHVTPGCSGRYGSAFERLKHSPLTGISSSGAGLVIALYALDILREHVKVIRRALPAAWSGFLRVGHAPCPRLAAVSALLFAVRGTEASSRRDFAFSAVIQNP